jgi:NodT family efflux transporter outer membrane factor (OMF) lipoprotein
MLKSVLRQSVGLTLAIWAVMLAACAPFDPKAESPADDAPLPATYSIYSKAAPRLQPWWHALHSDELNALIETALDGNFTLQQAWARLRQARARSIQQNAARFPDLTGNVETGLGRRGVDIGQTRTEGVETYNLGLVSNYELDLWGLVRAVGEAARETEQASLADLHTAAITLSAEIAGLWVRIITLRQLKSLLQVQLKSNRIRQELVELRYYNGLANSVDVFQQRELVARVQAEIPLVETQEALSLNQLALLLGEPAEDPLEIFTTALPRLDEVPAPGLPAQLLANRPDVRANGMRLQAARWQWAAARAARLPALRLTGTARYGADDLDLLFSNWLVNLAANLTAPLFDAGQRAAEVDRTRAEIDEQLARYRQTVYTAFNEVENALVQERNLHRNLDALADQLTNARNALSEATNRYRQGLDDYLPVLAQIINVQNIERQQIQRLEEIVLARIGLHRALGGPWVEAMETGAPELPPGNIPDQS